MHTLVSALFLRAFRGENSGAIMMKRIAIFGAAAALLLAVGSVGAHEGRSVGDYNFVVGFLNEPAYEGFQNGVSIRVTKPGDPGSQDGHAHGTMGVGQDEGADDHGSMSHEAMESQTPIGLQVSAAADASGGVAVTIETENWRWAPENVDRQHRDGEGHAHIYVDGVKVGRVFGPSYYIMGLEPGRHDIRVTLNANSHNNLLVDGELVESTVMVRVEDDGMAAMTAAESGDDHHGMAMVGVEGLEATLQVEVTHVDSGASQTMNLRPAFEDPGHYVADLIPTDVGVYRFRVFGVVEGNSVDESFISRGGGGDFDDIRASADLQFPRVVPAAREIEGAARGAQASADDAADGAAAARTMGLIGIVLGVIGVAVGGAALAVSLRK